MKEFRIARCLDDNEIHEYAIFADGSRKKVIKNDEKYGKYFEVDNELNTDCKSYLRFSYSGRVKDAVDMIKNGNGDCIQSSNFFGRCDKVIYFLNREIGEELRQKSLDGWKNTKFGYTIECGYKNSFYGYSMLNKKNERISVLGKERTPITFDSKEAANEYIDALIDRARYYAKRLVNNVSDVKDETERDKIAHATIDEIEEYTGTKFSVLMDFVFDMLTDDSDNLKIKNEGCNLDEIGYRIIQYIVK